MPKVNLFGPTRCGKRKELEPTERGHSLTSELCMFSYKNCYYNNYDNLIYTAPFKSMLQSAVQQKMIKRQEIKIGIKI